MRVRILINVGKTETNSSAVERKLVGPVMQPSGSPMSQRALCTVIPFHSPQGFSKILLNVAIWFTIWFLCLGGIWDGTLQRAEIIHGNATHDPRNKLTRSAIAT